MKYIPKKIANEPAAFRTFRQTPNATFVGYVDKDLKTGEEKVLKKALADEQGWICCYCNQSLQLERITVEHYITQHKSENSPLSPEKHERERLSFMNFLASCNYTDRNCSGERGNEYLEKLDPRNFESYERLITYDLEGHLLAKNIGQGVEKVKDEIKILKLNETALVKARKAAIDEARKRFTENNQMKRGRWQKADFDNEIARYRQKMKNNAGNLVYRQYCMAIIFSLEERQKRY